jgi:hypothetical protein
MPAGSASLHGESYRHRQRQRLIAEITHLPEGAEARQKPAGEKTGLPTQLFIKRIQEHVVSFWMYDTCHGQRESCDDQEKRKHGRCQAGIQIGLPLVGCRP